MGTGKGAKRKRAQAQARAIANSRSRGGNNNKFGSNPFDAIRTKSKHNVLGLNLKGTQRDAAKAKQKAVERRQQMLRAEVESVCTSHIPVSPSSLSLSLLPSLLPLPLPPRFAKLTQLLSSHSTLLSSLPHI
jgi:hypothetical protein